jgi:phosphoribosyl 1,2-cyclic phosphodiesterase
LVKIVVLGSGSRGNCTFVQGGRTRILIDAGFSAKEIARRLHEVGERLEDVDAVLVTHEHSDHVGGAGVLARKHRIPVFCCPETLREAGLEGNIPEWVPVTPGAAFEVGDIRVEPFTVPHDASVTLGFRVTAEGISVGYCTDLGHVTSVVRDRLSGSHVLIVESNHDLDMLRDGEYPWSLKQRVGGRHGHLSNEATATLLSDVVGGDSFAVALAHLSERNNAPSLAALAARDALERSGRDAVRLLVTAQDRVTPIAVA